ncbi:hypothetical protein FACS189450_03990 [Spirochaetia bacterium]|nr:hypothetical protein FACS189450_03990 [Spirochaetia bacterium]
MKRFVILIVVFLMVVVNIYSQTEERRRGFYIDMGFGFGGINYLGDTNDFVDTLKEDASIRMTLDLDMITIGWALTQNLYLVGTVAGAGDGFFDSSFNQSQINTYLFGIGTRFYPLKKYLQLGLDLGLSKGITLYNKKIYVTENGFGGKLSVGYDFDSTMTGFSSIVGGSFMYSLIENESILSYMAFIKIVFK